MFFVFMMILLWLNDFFFIVFVIELDIEIFSSILIDLFNN